ncbi:Rpp14/Pop5 family-domain-containing protein [Phaeosphaeria sp. MPI-PUGE-AT-0046c]|nr:Rpp14/Pop5 family-domain-containing protein [Phaeosphaeria sp. MPI-PUGE-AT-0046c]
MVRVKFRYLVVNFLYPSPLPSSKSKPSVPHLVQIHSPTPDAFHAGLLVRLIRTQIEDLYGDYGMGMVSPGLKINYWSPSTSTAIVRCPRDHYDMVWAALTYITHLPKPVDLSVVVRVVRVSGTIRKAEEEVIRRAKHIVERAKRWEGEGTDVPMVESVQRAADRERKDAEEVLVRVDTSEGEEDMSE